MNLHAVSSISKSIDCDADKIEKSKQEKKKKDAGDKDQGEKNKKNVPPTEEECGHKTIQCFDTQSRKTKKTQCSMLTVTECI